MTYDPFTGNFGDDDIGDNLFVDNPVEDVFGVPIDNETDDITDRQTEFSQPASNIPVGTVGLISYDRGDNEIVGRATALDRTDSPRPRRSKADRESAEQRATREAAHTGDRNIRGAAGQHASIVGARTPGRPTLASSVEDAAKRLRAGLLSERNGSGTDSSGVESRVDDFVKGTITGHIPKPKRQHTRTIARVADTKVDKLDFDCEVYGAKMNASGDWLVTLKVPFRYRSTVTDLSALAGMNIHTHMEVDGFA